MPRCKNCKEKFNQYREGLITQEELLVWLETHQIHGAIRNTEINAPDTYCGYDYKNQKWIVEEL